MTLTITYPDTESAKVVFNSIVPDDDNYVQTTLDNNKVIVNFKSNTAGQMRSAADDVMACIKISEETLGLVGRSTSDFDSDTLFE